MNSILNQKGNKRCLISSRFISQFQTVKTEKEVRKTYFTDGDDK